jgi:hypothetical protein
MCISNTCVSRAKSPRSPITSGTGAAAATKVGAARNAEEP